MAKVYYNQADPRWADHPYTAPSYPNATVKSAGCGPTCCAMVVSSTKEIIYPDTMCDIAKENGYRLDGGTANSFIPYVCDRWGLPMEVLHSSYDAFDKIKEGYFVVFLVGEGLWTTGGHFILGVGTRGDQIEIFDPYLYEGKFDWGIRAGKVQLEGNSAFVQIDTFKEYSDVCALWAIFVGKEITNGSTIDDEDVENAKIKYVSAENTANVRLEPKADSEVVGTLPRGTQVLDYEEKDGFARIGKDKWMNLDDLSNVKPNEEQPIIVEKKTGIVTANIGLNVRSGPSTGYAVIRALPKGEQVEIFEEQNGWARIGDGEWVCEDYLSITSTETPVVTTKTAYVRVNSSLNVRTGPSTGYEIIGSLYNGMVVTVYEERDGWARIGSIEWVCEDYLTFENNDPVIHNTVGQDRVFSTTYTYLYSNPDLTGTRYEYLAGTTVKILENVSGSVDKIYVYYTGRVAYCDTSVYR